MKKLNILVIALLFSQLSFAQYRYSKFGSYWLTRHNQAQLEVGVGNNFLQKKNAYLVPVATGINAQFEYQFSRSHLIGIEFGTRSSYLKTNKILQHFDSGSTDYRNLTEMTEGNNSSTRIGIGYSKVFNMKGCFMKMSIYGGINSTTKKKHEVEIFDNSQGGITDQLIFISTGKSAVSGYSKLQFSFAVPLGQDVTLMMGPRIYASTPSTIRSEYIEVKNGYLQYANVDYSRSSVVSLDFMLGILIPLNE